MPLDIWVPIDAQWLIYVYAMRHYDNQNVTRSLKINKA